jgi:colanic acid biosynthesis glycosyl transferase WcaI
MKVLLLSPFFYPEAISTGKYNTALAEALVDAGAKVQVVASHPLYPSWKPTFSDAKLDQVTIVRGGAWLRYPRAMLLRRAVFEVWYTFHVLKTMCLKRFNPDLVVAVFPPTLFFYVVSALFRSGVRRVGIVHDFQSALAFSQDPGPFRRLLRQTVRALDRKSFQRCDTLVVLSNAMARAAVKDYDVRSDQTIVAYPFVTMMPRQETGKELAAVLPDGVQHVVYSGALGNKQNPFALFDFFQIATAQFPDVHFHICSAGPIFEELCSRHSRSPAEGLHLRSLVDEANLWELYCRSTIQIIPQADGSADACLPSKLPNIVASGCLILAICDSNSELAQIVRQCWGTSVSIWDSEVLFAALESLLDRAQKQTAAERRRKAAHLVSKYFDINATVKAVLGLSREEDEPVETVAKS